MKQRNLVRTITALLGSHRFFYGVLIFFGLEALWIALSAVYPLPFDEDFHVGLIQLYSDHWSPFIASQPHTADAFGAVARDPSYLFHYLASFPYRLIGAFTDNQTAAIIVLRVLNVGLFVWGVALLRKALLQARLSPAFTHTCLLLFALVPIVPQLAAHVNYDNFLLVLMAWSCLLVARCITAFGAKQLPLRELLLLLVACLTMSVVKYESLPIVLAIVLFVVYLGWQHLKSWQKLGQAFTAARQQLPRRTLGLLAAGVVLLTGLAVQRYGVNVWSYQALKPDCGAVLNEARCNKYGPWERDNRLAKTKGEVASLPLAYTSLWLQSLHYRSFFAVSGITTGNKNYPPVLLPSAAAVIIVVMGITALLLYGRRALAGYPLLGFFLLLSALYMVALWANTYSKYLQTGEPVAINGRYLVLILVPLAAVFGRAIAVALNPWPRLKAIFACGAILLFLQAGGVFSFILRSDPNWYWSTSVVVDVNTAARKVLAPIMIEGPRYY